jgi:DNA adenine methylase
MNAPFSYYGAKNRMSGMIINYAPSNIGLYLEGFFGSGAVFFARRKWADVEVVNDLNSDIVNFFRVLRDKPEQLSAKLALMPFSREEMRASDEVLKSEAADDVTKATYFFVRAEQSFSGTAHGWRVASPRSNNVTDWRSQSRPDRIAALSKRLLRAHIENRPALDAMKAYDDPNTFMYLDPPYLSVVNADAKKRAYQNIDMLEDMHKEFIAVCLEMRAKIIISGYEHPLYGELVKAGWNRIEHVTTAQLSQRRGVQSTKAAMARTEVLWLSPNILGKSYAQISIFTE